MFSTGALVLAPCTCLSWLVALSMFSVAESLRLCLVFTVSCSHTMHSSLKWDRSPSTYATVCIPKFFKCLSNLSGKDSWSINKLYSNLSYLDLFYKQVRKVFTPRVWTRNSTQFIWQSWRAILILRHWGTCKCIVEFFTRYIFLCY